MRTHVVRARTDVVATKLGIILLSFFLSFHLLTNLRAAKGPERSGGTQPSEDFFGLALAGRVHALWVSETPLGTRIFGYLLSNIVL